MKGQLSVEFMVVFIGLLLIVGAVTYPTYENSKSELERSIVLAEAKSAAVSLATVLNTLYASGVGSKQTIEFWLPKGVAEVRMNVGADGVNAADENIAPNGYLDVQILLDFDGDGAWDNRRDAAVVVETLLPSMWDENGLSRDSDWIKENAIHVEDFALKLDPVRRTKHRTSFKFYYGLPPSKTIESWDLSSVEKRKLKTVLFGTELEVEAENDGGSISARLEFGDDELQGSGLAFTLGPLTSNGVSVEVNVSAPVVTVSYTPPTDRPYRQILITDLVVDYA